MARWVKNSGMVHDSPTHKARLRIDDLSMEYWNREALTELVSGFGKLERMYDFSANKNFEELRVLVACYYPTHVFKDITAMEEAFSATLHFEMEGWLITAAMQTQQNSTDQGDRRRQDEADYWNRQLKDKVRERQRQRKHSSDSGGSSGPVTQFNREQDHLRRDVTIDPQMEALVVVTNGDETLTRGTLALKKAEIAHFGQSEKGGAVRY